MVQLRGVPAGGSLFVVYFVTCLGVGRMWEVKVRGGWRANFLAPL